MWGWKPVERVVQSSKTLAAIGGELGELGFAEHFKADAYAVFKKAGNEWAFSGEELPIELAVAIDSLDFTRYFRNTSAPQKKEDSRGCYEP